MGREALRTLSICLGLAALLLPMPVEAASHEEAAPMPLLWVSYITAEPGKSNELASLMGEQGRGLYDGLVADGHALNWGVAQAINHFPDDDWTHMEWVSFANWAGVGEFVNRFMASQQTKSPEELAAEAAKWDELTVHGSHYDEVVRFGHVAGDPAARPAYIRVGYMATTGFGAVQKVGKMYKKWRAGMLDKALESGDILGHGYFERAIHAAGGGWTVGAYELLPGLGAMDALDKAEQAYMAGLSEEERGKWMEAVTSTFDLDGHYDRILLVIHHSADGAGGGDDAGGDDAGGDDSENGEDG